MAPLVVIRAGAKEIEYRDPRASWKQRFALLRQLHSDEEDQNEDDASSSGNSNDDHDDDDEDEHDDSTARIYGLSTELMALSGMNVFRCVECANVVADHADIIAKTFYGRTGKAFLMNAMFNVSTGPPRNRYLMTGMHTICDVNCQRCEAILGWKYIRAMEMTQKYKEGKFIMERAVVENEDDDTLRERY